MSWFFYNLLFPIGFLLMLPRFLLRMKKRGGYRDRFGQRFGCFDPEVLARLGAPGRLWVHAVSVGEMYVALDFIRAYRRRHPGARFVLSTVTSTGRALALEKADPADVVLYFPLDFPPLVRRTLDVVKPAALILTEGELWPNMLRQCAARGIPALMINARMSARSARGYGWIRPLTRQVLNSFARILAQSGADRDRYLALGAEPGRVEVLGSVKYDQWPDSEAAGRAAAVLKRIGWPESAPILLGGSTWPGEERALAAVFTRLKAGHPELRLVLVPRHAERAPEVLSELAALGLKAVRRSAITVSAAAPDVLLVDTTGELKSFYAAASVVFVGKSLFDNHGGQNFIEPAVYGKAILTGPNLENFPAIADAFKAVSALLQVADGEQLFIQADRLLADTGARDAMGRRAADLVAGRRGVTDATVDRVRTLTGDRS
jgi:3-deoxy-D-manno-octulosonic-acid transferase